MSTNAKGKVAVKIRCCQRDELPDVARLFNSAFSDSEFHARFMPGRIAYPHEYINFTLQRFRTRFVQPDMRMMVAEDGDGRIVGYATWQTVGDSSLAARWRQNVSWWWAFERPLLALEEYYIKYVINHCYDYRLLLKFRKLSNELYGGLPPHLHLLILAVAPDQQGKGVGREMLRWGLDLAEREQLPVVLESSQYARPVYESEGFKTYTTINMDHEREGKLDVPVMLWQPSALQGKLLGEDGLGGWRLRSKDNLENRIF